MNKIVILSLLLLSATFGEITKKFSFIGVSATSEKIDITAAEKTQGGFSVRYGQQTQEWRTTFSLGHHGSTYDSFTVELDKILLDDMFGTSKIRPYLGAALGYMKFDEENLGSVYEETDGFFYGGRFGFILYASDDYDIDVGYHYYKVENLDFLDDFHGASLAIHYFY